MMTLLAVASALSISGATLYSDCLKNDIKSCSIIKNHDILIADDYSDRRRQDAIHDQEDYDARRRARRAAEDRAYKIETRDKNLPGASPNKVWR